MFLLQALSVCAFIVASAAQLAPGIYRLSSVDFAQILASQSGSSILGLGGNGALGQTWFIAPSPDGRITIQNVQSRQYMSISGLPANGSAIVPSNTPFGWTVQGSGISVDGLFITDFIGQPSLVLTAGPPELRNQQWSIGSVTPLPSVYRLWNSATDLYLTASPSFPGPLNATSANPASALQLWTLAGTGPGSLLGTLASYKTGALVAISNGTVGTFSISQQFDYRWSFGSSGGGARLTSFTAPGPNVLSIGSTGQVVVDVPNSASQQTWTFVPADTSIAV